ncbi:hypothetical protein HQ520_00045, partial [bacterium]|nr:hypothetical protein [bacterium]
MLVRLPNTALTTFFDLILWPFHFLNPVWGLVFVSFITGAVMVWIFGKVSNQVAIRRVRERISGNLIGVHLFQHDLGVLMRLQGRILVDTLRYMTHALIPLLILIVPVILIMAQLHLRYASRPLRPGETTLVKATVRDGGVLEGAYTLETGSGLEVETPAVRIPSENEIAWRVRVLEPGHHVLTLTHSVGNDVVLRGQGRMALDGADKVIIAEEQQQAVPLTRTSNFAEAFLYPGEAPLPSSKDTIFRSVSVAYPPAEIHFLGLPIHWLAAFFILSILFGYALKGPLGVQL